MNIKSRKLDASLNKKVSHLLLFLALLMIPLLAGCTQTDQAQTTSKTSTQVVKTGDLIIGLYADGRVSIPSTRLNFEVSGKLTDLLVNVGQTVEAGDLLAVLDDADLKSAVENARRELEKATAAYQEAISNRNYTLSSEKIKLDALYTKSVARFDNTEALETLNDAKRKLEEKSEQLKQLELTYQQSLSEGQTSETLLKSLETARVAYSAAELSVKNAENALENAYAKFTADQTAAKENYDLQKLKYDNLLSSSLSLTNAKVNVSSAQSRLDEALSNLEKTKLYAPSSGTVTQITGIPGDFVSGRSGVDSSGSSTASNALITLYSPSSIYLTANINEGDIADLEQGQLIKASIDAVGLAGLPGTLVSVSTLPKIDNSGIVTYAVTAVLDSPSDRIFDGMSAFITYIKREKRDVVLVSNRAIHIEDGKQFVQIQLSESLFEKRFITAGLTNGSQSEVMKGLNAGETVIIGGVVQ